MSCGRSNNVSILPFYLPTILADADFLFRKELKNSAHVGYRRIYLKRRLLNGEYETDWQEISNTRVMAYGSTQVSIDDRKLNYFDQTGISIKFDNSDGYFSPEDYGGSFWNGYLSQYRTLVKIEAGYDVGCDSVVEAPTQRSLFYGILTDEVEQGRDNVVTLKFRSIASVFGEVPANLLPISTLSTATAEKILLLIRDYQDTSGTKVFQKYFSLTAWNIISTTAAYPAITTTSLGGSSCLQLIQKLAEAESAVFYVDENATFNFKSRTGASSVTASFFGGARFTADQAHSIIEISKYSDAVQKVYNRIRVHYLTADTESSYITTAENFTWGDSSSSFKLGVRTLDIDNTWLSTASAQSISQNLYNEYVYQKKEITFTTKFYPGLSLLDKVSVSYAVIEDDTSLWGTALIDRDAWKSADYQHNEFRDQNFYVTKVIHNIDKFYTEISGRAV